MNYKNFTLNRYAMKIFLGIGLILSGFVFSVIFIYLGEPIHTIITIFLMANGVMYLLYISTSKTLFFIKPIELFSTVTFGLTSAYTLYLGDMSQELFFLFPAFTLFLLKSRIGFITLGSFSILFIYIILYYSSELIKMHLLISYCASVLASSIYHHIHISNQKHLLILRNTHPDYLINNNEILYQNLKKEISRSHQHNQPLFLLSISIPETWPNHTHSYSNKANGNCLPVLTEKIKSIIKKHHSIYLLDSQQFIILLPECNEILASMITQQITHILSTYELFQEFTFNVKQSCICHTKNQYNANDVITMIDIHNTWKKKNIL
jgi:GGDEF domain-containing protein